MTTQNQDRDTHRNTPQHTPNNRPNNSPNNRPNNSPDNIRTNKRDRTRSWLAASLLVLVTLALGVATQGELMRTAGSKGHGAKIKAPNSGHHVSLIGNLDRTAVLMGSDGLVRMELVIGADDDSDALFAHPSRTPTDLVIVLDRSGSMQGQKISDARAAVRQLVSQLGPDDRFSLVTFSSGSQLTIPLSRATPEAVTAWVRTIESIASGGGTHMAPALDLAFDTIDATRSNGRTPRAILISDGLAAEPHPVLRSKAMRAARGEYALTTVGIGTDFDETLMSQLSDAGTGNYYYLADARNLAEVFSNEFETASETVATGLAVRIDPAPGVSVVEASGYPLEHSAGAVHFRPGSLFAGQQRHVWVTFRVPTNTPAETELAKIELTYTDNLTGKGLGNGISRQLTLNELPKIACVAEQKDFFANLDVDRWAKAVVVEEYNDLYAQVAAHVKSGRKDKARKAVNDFRSRNQAINQVAASPRVAAQLDEALELEHEIDAAFAGKDQHKKQNLLSKELHALGYETRREGSRK